MRFFFSSRAHISSEMSKYCPHTASSQPRGGSRFGRPARWGLVPIRSRIAKAFGTDGVTRSENNALSRATLIGSHDACHICHTGRSHMAEAASPNFGLLLFPGVVRAPFGVSGKRSPGAIYIGSLIHSFTHSLTHSFMHPPGTCLLSSLCVSDSVLHVLT